MTQWCRAILVHTLLLTLLCVSHRSDAFTALNTLETINANTARSIALPRLTEPLTLDGHLTEWSSAWYASFKTRNSMAYLPATGHEWRGVADASLEAYGAWTDDGVCLGFVVADDQIINDRSDDRAWEQDCLEIFLDGRGAGLCQQIPYTPGAYQIFVTPPQEHVPSRFIVKERDGTIPDAQVMGRRTPHGYVVEVLIPWSACPGVTPKSGSQLALGFALVDYDASDGGAVQPRYFSFPPVRDLWVSPHLLIGTTLIGDASESGYTSVLAVEYPHNSLAARVLPIAIDTGTLMPATTDQVTLVITDRTGDQILRQRLPCKEGSIPWSSTRRAVYRWDRTSLPDGVYTVDVTAHDRRGQLLGRYTTTMAYSGHVFYEAEQWLRHADINKRIHENPWVAAGYLGAAACLERVKSAIATKNADAAAIAIQECSARIAMLDGQPLSPPDGTVYDLLTLTQHPEAQVTVMFPSPQMGVVTVNWGALPLIMSTVSVGPVDMTVDDAPVVTEAVDDSGATILIQQGRREISVTSVSAAAARLLADRIVTRTPLTLTDADAIRVDIVAALSARYPTPLTEPESAFTVYAGDPHVHTMASRDATPTPIGALLEGLYAGFDFLAITDHNTSTGAVYAQRMCRQHRLAYPLLVGVDLTMEWAHLNVYPITQSISTDLPLDKLVAAAHQQGAVIQWNHPGMHALSAFETGYLTTGLAGTGIDAYERGLGQSDTWPVSVTSPVCVGTASSHIGMFFSGERTLVLAKRPSETAIASAIRRKAVVVMAPNELPYFIGDPAVIQQVIAALADGARLKAAKARQWRDMLHTADLAALVRNSSAYPTLDF